MIYYYLFSYGIDGAMGRSILFSAVQQHLQHHCGRDARGSKISATHRKEEMRDEKWREDEYICIASKSWRSCSAIVLLLLWSCNNIIPTLEEDNFEPFSRSNEFLDTFNT